MYNPFAESIAYAPPPLGDRAAAALAVATTTTLQKAIAAYGERPFAVLMECVWGSGAHATGADMLRAPDRHGCTPWLWLWSDGANGPPHVPSPPTAPQPWSWALVQTAEKKRALLQLVHGAVLRTLHVKRHALAAEAASAPTPFTLRYSKGGKVYIDTSKGDTYTVVEVATPPFLAATSPDTSLATLPAAPHCRPSPE